MDAATRSALKERTRALRSILAEVNVHIEDGDYNRAYGSAEQAQHAAFDLKSEIQRRAELVSNSRGVRPVVGHEAH